MLNRVLGFGSRLCFHLQIKESAESGKNLRKNYPQAISSKGSSKLVFLNRRTAARYRVLASIIPGRERFSWNLSF